MTAADGLGDDHPLVFQTTQLPRHRTRIAADLARDRADMAGGATPDVEEAEEVLSDPRCAAYDRCHLGII